MKKIVVAGIICVDLTPVFAADRVKNLGDLLIPGKLIQMNGISIAVGGAVGNTGLALKVLGADVSLIGKAGTDELGTLLADLLRQYGAADHLIRDEKSVTGYTFVLAVPGIDRVFLHAPGANDTFCYDDIDFSEVAGASIFHLGYPPVMRRMYEDNGKELVRVLRKVHDMGVAVSLDMSAVDPATDAAKADWAGIIRDVLPYVDFFVPSVEEVCYMIDKPRFDEWTARSGGGDITEAIRLDDVEPLAERLLDWGAKVVLIKCGTPGMYLRTADAARLSTINGDLLQHPEAWADLAHFEKSYVPEKVLSGTGAGDTSIAAFLLAITKGYSWQRCLQLAAATGASCVEAYDSISGLRSFEELEKKIDSGWKKLG